jgi:hypothetical protein
VGRAEGKRSLGKLKGRWEDNINILMGRHGLDCCGSG